MDRKSSQRARRNLGASVALIALFPVVSMGWASLKVLFGPGRWGPRLIGLSILGNVLFVLVMVLGYFVSEASPPSPEEEVALLGADFVRCVSAPLHFVEARPESELRSALAHSVYVSFHGIIRARFEFADEAMDTLVEVQLSDDYGRPWIRAPLETGKLFYTRYYDENGTTKGDVTLVDEDGDGIPDLMIDWTTGMRFRPEQELQWREIVPKEKTSE